jgi:tetratricopeptide (TPR) repeat protein
MRRITFLALPLAALLPLAACSGNSARKQPDSASAQLSFGTNMAQRGLWQEALFRFREAERLDPQNFRVHNNLGVAYEAAGDYDNALQQYKRALEIAPNSREAKSNYARFVEFYQSFKAKPGEKKAVILPTTTTGKTGKPGDPGHRPASPASPPPPDPRGPNAPGGINDPGRRGDPGVPPEPPNGIAPPPPSPPPTSPQPASR